MIKARTSTYWTDNYLNLPSCCSYYKRLACSQESLPFLPRPVAPTLHCGDIARDRERACLSCPTVKAVSYPGSHLDMQVELG